MILASPLGPIGLTEGPRGLRALVWGPGDPVSPLIARAFAQLEEYFAGRLREFDLPLDLAAGLTGAVQAQMLAIPWGETRTYGQLSRALGAPAQAVGQACGANPLPIIVPCHRILGAKGLGGFSAPGGVEAKAWLLRHEGGLLL